jgi:hypothetical protein
MTVINAPLSEPSGIDHDVQRLLRQLPLPILADAPRYPLALDAIDAAADSRQGVLVLGGGDCGKSVALSWAVQEFARAEAELQQADTAYRPRRVVRFNVSRPRTPMDLLSAIYRQAFDTDPVIRVRGRTKDASDLLRELLLRLRDEEVAVLVLDDADALSAELLEWTARVMAVATDDHPDRLQADGGGSLVPQGVGVVLSGTARLEATIHQGSEVGNAWKKVVRIGPVSAVEVPYTLCALLPPWASAAAHMGDEAWAQLITKTVSYGRAMPIGTLDALARLYVRRAVVIAQMQGQTFRRVEDIPWDAPLLEQVRQELLVPTSSYTAAFDTSSAAA